MEGLAEIAKLIDARGTRSAFAEAVGCSEPHLSLILKGERGMSLDLAARLERELGIEISPSRVVRAPAEARQ